MSPGTLNRAEWVKFLGLFFNMEAAASTYFTGVEQQYNALKVQLGCASRAAQMRPIALSCASCPANPDHLICLDSKRAASTAAFKPVVAWVTFYNYSGDLAFQIDFTAYKADYVKVRVWVVCL